MATAGAGTSLLAVSVGPGAAADGSGATRAMRPNGSAPMIAPSFAARLLLSLRTLPIPHFGSRLDASPSHAVAPPSDTGETSAVMAARPTVGAASTLVAAASPCEINKAPSAPRSWLTCSASAPTMIEPARQASVTFAPRRNFGEGHNRPNSGCRLYTGATTPSRGTPPADRDYTQRPRCCFLSVHAIFPPRLKSAKTQDRPAAPRDTTSAALPVANSHSWWGIPPHHCQRIVSVLRHLRTRINETVENSCPWAPTPCQNDDDAGHRMLVMTPRRQKR